MCIDVLPACMYAYHVPMGVKRRTKVTDGCEPPHGCWELNSGPVRGASTLELPLTSETYITFKMTNKIKGHCSYAI